MTEVASVLYGREDIRRRVEELGRAITGDYAGREPVLISVLKGGTMFLADLMRQLPLPLEVHFMAISRYGDAEESFGRVQILLDLDVDLAGRDVLARRGHRRHRPHPLVPVVGPARSRDPRRSRCARCWTRRSDGSRRCPSATPASIVRTDSSWGTVWTSRSGTATSRDILAVDDLKALRADPDVLVPLLSAP